MKFMEWVIIRIEKGTEMQPEKPRKKMMSN